MYIGVGPPPSSIADPVLIFTQAGEAAGAPGQLGAVEPQRERGVFVFVCVFYSICLRPELVLDAPGEGLGVIFLGRAAKWLAEIDPAIAG